MHSTVYLSRFDGCPIPHLHSTNDAPQINQKIAENICSDHDVASFRLICQSTNDALNGDRKSFWRRRFLDQFDKPAIPRNQSMIQINDHIYEKYKTRCAILKRRTDFATVGNSHQERQCLQTLFELVVGKFVVSWFYTDVGSSTHNILQKPTPASTLTMMKSQSQRI